MFCRVLQRNRKKARKEMLEPQTPLNEIEMPIAMKPMSFMTACFVSHVSAGTQFSKVVHHERTS